MRFDQSKGIKLRDWINNAEEEIISEILFKYGNEKIQKNSKSNYTKQIKS